jgi:hypothetical protein
LSFLEEIVKSGTRATLENIDDLKSIVEEDQGQKLKAFKNQHYGKMT